MRWELLFADLEALADATDRAAFEADVADRARSERAAVRLTERLRAHLGAVLALRLADRGRVTGRLVDVGADWLLLDDAGSVLIPLAAVTVVEGLGRASAGEAGEVQRRARITVALRRLARDRAVVRVATLDGGIVVGTLDRVGADHVDLALHAQDELRRASAVRSVAVLPLAAIVQIRAA